METLETAHALKDKEPSPKAKAAFDRSLKILTLLSQTVRERRFELGMTQDKLADLTGLHRTYISDIERGARNLSVRSLVKLAEALQVEPSLMLGWAEKKLTQNHRPEKQL